MVSFVRFGCFCQVWLFFSTSTWFWLNSRDSLRVWNSLCRISTRETHEWRLNNIVSISYNMASTLELSERHQENSLLGCVWRTVKHSKTIKFSSSWLFIYIPLCWLRSSWQCNHYRKCLYFCLVWTAVSALSCITIAPTSLVFFHWLCWRQRMSAAPLHATIIQWHHVYVVLDIMPNDD